VKLKAPFHLANAALALPIFVSKRRRSPRERGEETANPRGIISPVWLAGPILSNSNRPLTESELKERERQLSLLSTHHVADAYRRAYEACRMEGDRLPRASSVQELVATWKVLRKWRIRGPERRG
jgi:hypothetical protein